VTHPVLTWPNLITLLRLWLVPAVVIALWQQKPGWALILFAVAGIADGLDGWLARRLQQRTELGARLDPIADKALLVATWSVLMLMQKAPFWLWALIVARDLWILLGAWLYERLIDRLQIAPSWLSKWTTAFQIVAGLALIANDLGPLPPALLELLLAITAVLTIASGVHYTWVWGRRAWRARH